MYAIALVGACALAAGFWLDAQSGITQPMLFWSFLAFGLTGCALGCALNARRDPSTLRRALAAVASLVAWRVAYFPLMVISGWLASVGEWLLLPLLGRSLIYPTFVSLILAINLVISTIASAAVTVPAASSGRARFGRLGALLSRPPRPLLWAIGAAALPVAFMVSFSKPSDLVLFADRPWSQPRRVPEIHAPEHNPYAIIMREHQMALPAQVLAFNALITYPLVPESPWGAAMKGTLEFLALENPIATSLQRIDEHYLAYLAAHARLHP